MTPIDLFDYTHSCKKIPSHVLKHKSPEPREISSYQIIGAFIIDAILIASMCYTAAKLTHISTQTLMITPALREAFSKIDFAILMSSLLPLIITSYFFASFFFNRGQSYGMFKMNARIEMPEMNYRSSVFWGLYAAGAIMSGGLSLLSYQWLQHQGWGSFKGHDHLYAELITEREISPVDLIAATEAFHTAPAVAEEEETYLQAA